MNRHAAAGIDFIGDLHTGISIAADAVLGRQQRHELQVLVSRDEIDVRGPASIDAGVIGNQSHPAAAKRGGNIFEEHLDPGSDGPFSGRQYGRRASRR